jgi:riboflavin kinase/FMN adenylyltransferase
MKVYRSLGETPADFGPSVLTIGNFDGLHCGHRRILRRVRELAEQRGWKPSVLTFDPHPTRVVAPSRTPQLMSTPEQRVALMGEEGMEQTLILPFVPKVARLSPEEFVTEIVVGRLGARAVLVGDNFRFGYRHAGDVRVLAELGKKLGFETGIVPAVEYRGLVVSSSGIRELLRSGRVSLAGRLLLRPYGIEGDVVSGRGVGSKETVPTLNLDTQAEVIPALGVYLTRTRDLDDRREWPSITNIGYRPTFGQSETLTIETFLLSPLTGETPRRIRLDFLWRVRDERKFDSSEELRAQILKDVRVAQRYFERIKAWAKPLAAS